MPRGMGLQESSGTEESVSWLSSGGSQASDQVAVSAHGRVAAEPKKKFDHGVVRQREVGGDLQTSADRHGDDENGAGDEEINGDHDTEKEKNINKDEIKIGQGQRSPSQTHPGVDLSPVGRLMERSPIDENICKSTSWWYEELGQDVRVPARQYPTVLSPKCHSPRSDQ